MFADEPIDFVRDIRPLLSDRCYLCHGPDAGQRATDLRFDLTESAHEIAIVKGEPDASEMILRIESTDGDELMPPPDSNLSLTSEEKRLLRQWVAEGGKYEEHWAFVAPRTPALPDVKQEGWVRNPIDAFVLAKLQKQGLTPSPIADRATLIRRLTFDLTGLPPTLADIDAFVADQSADAYEKVVDRLLASRQYGERMAVDWLDVARYADTYGYQNDRYRAMWPWRDWVIQAFNDNLPYDQFVTWQIAGDLLPDATQNQVLATAFNRNHRQTNEGGSVEEEFRAEYVADRVNTFGTAFLGMTLECCRCHDHKYDPISQREYYQLSAYFNSIDEAGLYSHFNQAVPTPTLRLSEENQEAEIRKAQEQIAILEQRLQELTFDQDAYQRWRSSLSDVRRNTATAAAAERSLAEMLKQSLQANLIGDYPLDALQEAVVPNRAHPDAPGRTNDDPTSIAGRVGQALELSGENSIDVKSGNNFSRTQPFAISLWLNLPEVFDRAVIFHRSRAWTDSGSRGYELLIEEGKLSAALVHFWPGNAIRVRSVAAMPIDQWTHVSMVYDGSSRAAGLTLYINGEPAEIEVVRDGLTKHIHGADGYGGGEADTLTIGQRFRDKGLKHGAVDELKVFDRQLSPLELQLLYLSDAAPENLAEVLYNMDDASLQDYFITQQADYRLLNSELRTARETLAQIVDPVPEIMVMRELPTPRPTFVLLRGAYDAIGEPVERATPKSILPLETSERPNRLDLAQWLVHPDHPLTARVAVNRFWQSLFGVGLVGTAEDFGLQGESPTHPELLDWLARDFVDQHWDVKALIKKMVMSATYRQSSNPTSELLERDPENRWLSRGPANRLSAEMIRDLALASSGLLVDQIGGPPVKPYQPAGLWEEKAGISYERDQGEGSYRRSLYTYWKRTSPPPSMMTLDASNREVCVVRRQTTMTPMQTLVLLNDPQYIEAARMLAVRAIRHSDETASRIAYIFRSLTGRDLTPSESKILLAMYAEQLQYFQSETDAASQLLAIGDQAVPPDMDQHVLATLCVVAEGLISFDETVMKR
ncbi:DUF1553 domain-containing protein [Aureliella helgolandensis]|uniref:DUF1553 domain-containing protein n=1 Tax=Aureliella helgolandensis TaxID=2527968 RepID=UPI0018D1016F|nr:DUF1553 domain-containing protein [Aureliella helgolandensis]